VRNDINYLAKPIAMVGGQLRLGPAGSTLKPSAASCELYEALRQAAPLELDEIASILEGYWPFEIEEGDDKAPLISWYRIRRRLQQAVENGVLADTPTLKEALIWATEVGLPMCNAERLKAAIGGPDVAPKSAASKYASRHDPEIQRIADVIVADELSRSQRRPKKAVVAQAIKDRSTGKIRKKSVSTIERQFVLS